MKTVFLFLFVSSFIFVLTGLVYSAQMNLAGAWSFDEGLGWFIFPTSGR
ncbi:MAG: hypothetical protein ACPL7B_13540 [Candidatus Poribacteria bacterium]